MSHIEVILRSAHLARPNSPQPSPIPARDRVARAPTNDDVVIGSFIESPSVEEAVSAEKRPRRSAV